MARILVGDDDLGALSALKTVLEEQSFAEKVFLAATPSEVEVLIDTEQLDVGIFDLNFGEGYETYGLEALRKILKKDPAVRVVILTGQREMNLGVEALKLGAMSFVQKPAELDHLVALVRDAVNQVELRRRFYIYSGDDVEGYFFGSSKLGKELKDRAFFAAKLNLPILITGATGTGKSRLARLIHNLDERRTKKRFVVFSPSSCSEELIYAELFGAKKGAYTGLTETREGLVEAAHGGTLLIDEVGDLPPSIQLNFLRLLQDKVFKKLGESEEREIDFRLISATNKNLSEEIEAGRFRSDLYYRISHFVIKVPSLEERKEDIPLLVEHLAKNICERLEVTTVSFSTAAIDYLVNRTWKGNIRELESCLEKSIVKAVLEASFSVDVRHFDETDHSLSGNSRDLSFYELVENFEKKMLAEAFAKSGRNQSECARLLKLDRTQLRRYLVKYNLI